ncbi:MAG TPA: aquaporin [Acidimicrobiia bacterium]|nr:aquaporin [Acidimicrobiia bacterium]
MRPVAIAAEFAGTALLLVVIVGSGIAVETLGAAGGTQLFVHAVVVGLGLGALIATFAPVSGAHLNPAVTLGFLLRGRITTRAAGAYVVAQVAGAILGTLIAHASYGKALVSISSRERFGGGLWLGELIATVVLVGVILVLFESERAVHIPAAVGAWVAAAIVAMSSTGFANPAVTVARTATDSYTGIAPASVPMFVVFQIGGALSAVAFVSWHTRQMKQEEPVI